MANTKKFNNPVQFTLRIEQDTKERIEAVTDNITEFINEAIKSQLGYEEQARKVSE